MRRCPTCERTYDAADEFCFEDGTRLIADNISAPTVVIPPIAYQHQQTAPRLNNSMTMVLGGLVVLLIVAGAILGTAYFMSDKSSEKNERTNASPTSPTISTADEDLIRENERLKTQLQQKNLQTNTAMPPPVGANAIVPAGSSGIVRTGPSYTANPTYPILCRIPQSTYFRVLGSSGVTDNNGTWYLTDYCGRQGYIHTKGFRLLGNN